MKIFKPNLILKSVFEIDIVYLRKNKIKGVIFDIDNTLAYNKEKTPTTEILKLMKDLQGEGFKIGISSNNNKERVEQYCKEITTFYAYKANKPLLFKTLKMVKKFKLKRKELCIVGDQVFTDMLGGNLFGFHTILVLPFDTDENKFIGFKRKIEKFVLR